MVPFLDPHPNDGNQKRRESKNENSPACLEFRAKGTNLVASTGHRKPKFGFSPPKKNALELVLGQPRQVLRRHPREPGSFLGPLELKKEAALTFALSPKNICFVWHILNQSCVSCFLLRKTRKMGPWGFLVKLDLESWLRVNVRANRFFMDYPDMDLIDRKHAVFQTTFRRLCRNSAGIPCWCSVRNVGMTLINHPTGGFLQGDPWVHSHIPYRTSKILPVPNWRPALGEPNRHSPTRTV